MIPRDATHLEPPSLGALGDRSGAIVGALLFDAATHRPQDWSYATQALAFLAVGTTGLIVARKQPSNPIGWIYLAVWVFVGLLFSGADSYAYWAKITHPGAPGGTFFEWLTNWAWVPVFGVFLTFPFLLFPDGHLPSRRWRPVAWLAALSMVLWAIAFALENHDYTNAAGRHVPNPYTVRSLIPLFDTAREVLALVFMVTLGLSIASLVVRFRRSRGDEREQIKWLMIAATITLVWLLLPFERGNGGPIDFIQGFVLALIPISVGVAILKYRLYDIDVVISKALVYGALAALITVVYVAIVVGVGSLVQADLRPLGSGDRAGRRRVPARAGAPAALGEPARVRQARNPLRGARPVLRTHRRYVRDRGRPPSDRARDRRGDRRRAGRGLAPGRRPAPARGGLAGRRRAFTAGDVGRRPAPAVRRCRPDRARHVPGRGARVRHRQEATGRPAHPDGGVAGRRPGSAGRPRPVERPADSRAGGAPTTDAEQAAALQASRQRIVAAQDAERRRLERNIHDGAQQHLVALAVKLRLARGLLAKDPEKARTMLGELRGEVDEALDTLYGLALGIYPPILEEQGIAPALAAQYVRSDLPVQLHTDGTGRYPIDAEAAVYFCVLEALQNAAKYARATTIDVRLADDGGVLTFEVTDDGVGFETNGGPTGTGIAGMRDRLAVLGGDADVWSEPGNGTRVRGRIPIDQAARART